MRSEPASKIVAAGRLTERLDPVHLRQRLGIEAEGDAPLFAREGRTWLHPESSPSAQRLLLGTLRLLGLYRWGQRNAWDIGVVEHRVELPGLPPALDGLRLLQLSDLHLDAHPCFPSLLAEVIAPLEYDLCVLTGDYRYRTSGPWDAALEGLRSLLPVLRQPVYGVLGNHDSIRMVPAMEDMGVRMLLNESETLDGGGQSLFLVGVDDPHFFRADNLEKACAGIPERAASVLLCHSPELYRQAAHCGLRLMLCGHTHGGQICLPGGFPLFTNADCPRQMARGGPWRYGSLQGYTSVGAGSSVVDVRFNCRPEVTVHTLCCPNGQ